MKRDKARYEREKMLNEQKEKRDFESDQIEVRRKMKDALLVGLREKIAIDTYYKQWILSIYIIDILDSVKTELSVRRERRDDIERV